MPIQYSAVPAHRLVHVIYSGSIGLHDIRGFFARFNRDFSAFPTYDELCDARGVTAIDLSVSERRALFDYIIEDYRRVNYAKRIAFVAPEPPAREIVGHIATMFARTLPVIRFVRCDTMREGYAHLRLPDAFRLPEAMKWDAR
ncbi:MAG: hypothetical protein AAGL96_00855 [Pseudomonadota bacterium]